MNAGNAADRVVRSDLVRSGAVTPAVDRAYSLSEVPAAVNRVRDGLARGKVAIDLVPRG